LLERNAGKKGLRGGVLAVAYEGQQVVHRFGRGPTIVEGGADGKDGDSDSSSGALPNVPLLTTAIARLVEIKQLSLDATLSVVLQGTSLSPPGGWRGITVRQVLEHTSNLEAAHPRHGPAGSDWLRFAERPRDRDTFPFADATIEGLILRTLTGQPNLTGPEEMILGALRPPSSVAIFLNVPPYLTHKSLALPDVSDSGELWARNSLVLGQLWLNGGIYAHKRLLSRKTVDQFLAPKNEGNATFTAGWEVSLAPGHSLSARAFGFTASEGPSLWMDPAHALCVAFLPDTSARPAGEPPPGDTHTSPLRAELHDAIYAALVLRK
jgi:hypothetical protein